MDVKETIDFYSKRVKEIQELIIKNKMEQVEAERKLKAYRKIEKEIEYVERGSGQNPSLQSDEAGNKDGQN